MSGREYRVEFTRIGRDHHVPPLETGPVDGPNHLAEVIRQYARPRLLSREVEVHVDLSAGSGLILCGFQTGGRFTITRVAAPEAGEQP